MISNQSYCFSGIVILLYFFFLISLVLHTLASSVPHYCRDDQRDALLEFKHEFPVNESNSSLFFSSWNKSSDCCSWDGVTCNAKSGKVIILHLDFIRYKTFNNSLKANSGLFKLQHLRNLTLNCNLYGEIPSSLGNLSNLTHLDLWKNDLEGELPASLGNLTQLRYLDLRNNKFCGNIPVSFGKLTKLFHLDISGNQFTGEFTPVLLNLTSSLSVLRLSSNLFKTTLPPDMSQFQNLEEFDASENSFFGPFPTSLFMIPSLTEVNLKGNQLKGPIEFRNTSSSSQLMYLYLSQNKFDGPIPKSISKLDKLGFLDLADNNFNGSFPSSSNLAELWHIDVSNNKLDGEIPSWFGGVLTLLVSHNSFSGFGKSINGSQLGDNTLQTWDFGSNSFRGPLPHWLCKLNPSSYLDLDLSNNGFSGSIPQCLSNTIGVLTALDLQNNNLSGILPSDLFVNATSLSYVDFSNNQLEGKIPESLINCTPLWLLNVGSNRFKDKFPSWLGSLRYLNILILRSNEFYGPLYHPHVSIGFHSLKIVDISNNDFNGTLPPFYFSSWCEITFEVTCHKGLMSYGSNSPHYGSATIEMVNKGVDTKFERIRRNLRAIDFSGNKFSGKIPKSIELLKGLRLLNLSGNAFTSHIPQSLENLTDLEALDLSRNQLSGQIPPILGSLSFLAVMNFSHNNLQGPIPQGTQFQSQKCSSFMDNPNLYGLEDICGETHVPSPTPQESEDLPDPEEQVISWIAAAIAYGPGVFFGLVIGLIFFPHKHKWFG